MQKYLYKTELLFSKSSYNVKVKIVVIASFKAETKSTSQL